MLNSNNTTTNANNNQPARPELQEWLGWPRSKIFQYVRQRQLSLMLSIDGTQRYYLVHRPAEHDGQGFDFEEYVEVVAGPMARLFDLLFSLGVHTVMNMVLLPPNFQRASGYAARVVEQSKRVFGGALFKELYTRHNALVRLFGDYDVASAAQGVRSNIEDLAGYLAALTPAQTTTNPAIQAEDVQPPLQPRLMLGFYADSFTHEIAARSYQLLGQKLTSGTNTPPLLDDPTDEELRWACFPEGPSRLDLLIEAGWLKVGGLVHPLLDGGHTDIYNLSFLALDLDEPTLRRILYDHLFLRGAWSDDQQNYSAQDIAALRSYYRQHQGEVIGLGRLVGPGLWYADTLANGGDGTTQADDEPFETAI